MNKKQLQKENAELKARLLIKQHTKSYIHIPFNLAALGRFFAFLGSIGLVIVNSIALTYLWKVLNISVLFGSNEEILANRALINWHQLIIAYPIVVMYVTGGLSVVCLAALIKGGFDKLKRYSEEGLIGGLIEGLIGSLIGGLIGSLIGGLIFGLIAGLIAGLIGGLICGLLGGSTGGLIFGLIVGLWEEFS